VAALLRRERIATGLEGEVERVELPGRDLVIEDQELVAEWSVAGKIDQTGCHVAGEPSGEIRSIEAGPFAVGASTLKSIAGPRAWSTVMS
jgi:hypothetical protein